VDFLRIIFFPPDNFPPDKFFLLKNPQIDSFKWALTKFKENLKGYPTVIFSDEEEALRSDVNLFFNLF